MIRLGTVNLDLRLLAIVNQLYRTGNVSRTADNLKVTQSTIRMGLYRLRKHFSDPLFVRTSRGMEPTQQALEIIGFLEEAQEVLQAALSHHIVFEPAISGRIFRIASADIAKVTMLPRLMSRLTEVAPSIKVEQGGISAGVSKSLESGEIDLAVGFIPPMGAGFYQQRLFKERLTCVVRAQHPRIEGDRITLQQFQEEGHIAVASSGTGYGIVERTLESRAISRRVALRVAGFLGLSEILCGTDFVAVVPGQLGEFLARSGQIKLVSLPFNMPVYYVQQHWHGRYTHDPGHKWLRNQFAELFLEHGV